MICESHSSNAVPLYILTIHSTVSIVDSCRDEKIGIQHNNNKNPITGVHDLSGNDFLHFRNDFSTTTTKNNYIIHHFIEKKYYLQ